MDDLRSAALQALRAVRVDDRLRATQQLADAGLRCDAQRALADPGDVPGRPPRPALVAPAALAARPAGKRLGRAALLHALAHIEFNAIGLALDAVWRFPALPEAFYRDWAQVALEEARHFVLLRERLAEAGFDYGDFPAHDGLWEIARRTSDDVLARMALVPRTLEARGLDASPAVRAKLAAAGDEASARVVDLILRDEIGHVALGNRWFHELCAARGLQPLATYCALARRHGAPRPRGPLNLEARAQAGFSAQELALLQREAG